MSRIPPVDPATAQGAAKELLGAVRRALGVTPEIVEIVRVTVLNILTNDLNRVAATEIDFPLVRAHAAAA